MFSCLSNTSRKTCLKMQSHFVKMKSHSLQVNRANAHQSFKLTHTILTLRNVLIFFKAVLFWGGQNLILVCSWESLSSSVIKVFICWLLVVNYIWPHVCIFFLTILPSSPTLWAAPPPDPLEEQSFSKQPVVISFHSPPDAFHKDKPKQLTGPFPYLFVMRKRTLPILGIIQGSDLLLDLSRLSRR